MMHGAPNPQIFDPPRAIGAVRHFAAEQTICFEGDLAAHFVLIIDGLVRGCSAFPDGRRFIGAFYAAGDFFGVESRPAYQTSAEAVCGTNVIFYPAWNPVEAAGAETGLTRQVLGSLMRGADQARDHARLLGRCNAIERLAAFLLECSEPGKERPLVTLEMTRRDIADYLGLTVETVSRSLAQLKRGGLIAFVSARQIRLLNLAALRVIKS